MTKKRRKAPHTASSSSLVCSIRYFWARSLCIFCPTLLRLVKEKETGTKSTRSAEY